MLLYLVVKNHSFVDGNKRIAATLFLWFMQNNGILYRPDGTKRVADAALVALTLMIAESHTDEMETMVKVVVNLINQPQHIQRLPSKEANEWTNEEIDELIASHRRKKREPAD